MNPTLAYLLGFFTLPAVFVLSVAAQWAFSRDGSIGVECDNCKAAGYRTGRYRDREVFAIEQWAIRAWHREVVARRWKHRIEWQRMFEALPEGQRRRALAKVQAKYGTSPGARA